MDRQEQIRMCGAVLKQAIPMTRLATELSGELRADEIGSELKEVLRHLVNRSRRVGSGDARPAELLPYASDVKRLLRSLPDGCDTSPVLAKLHEHCASLGSALDRYGV